MNKIIIAFIAGLAVGIVFAPAKGSDTRKNIRSKLSNLPNEVEEWAEDIASETATSSTSTTTES